MDKKELKKIMTDLAAGHISQKEVELLINPEKTQPDKPVQEFKASEQKDKPKKTKTRKRTKLNKTGGKTK